ncbi:TIGR03619 family F420-dependent LLM class oxidoreductase [Streptomyces sp. CB03238]|uniref:TIGR03619 family F420-dependent LLM class oxidoreductase n=1 Tax=Streptomyces sp. CB03238 TaxID=1907777 RepID=UPI000A0FEC3A|nr:TIGR03619 family F420-dependent LLM class oxidoreductase [Streptomyces sp. CB03238]ORT56734.1 hypothetical protein BKD26_26505 [Streptomyces sp. CB03238]
MRLGCDLPPCADPGGIRAFAQAAEDIGYDHLAVAEHVLAVGHGSALSLRAAPRPAYESSTVLGFLSGVTSRIELVSAMLLLPLRPAPLAAKQAAELDRLSGQRLRLGVAVGWDAGELLAHGVEPGVRGELFEEQVQAMRLLWAKDAVDFHGRHVRLSGAGLVPRPRRSIPLWMGGGTARSMGVPPQRAMRRIAALADGFTMSAVLGKRLGHGERLIAQLLAGVDAAGRDRSAFGIEARLLTHLTQRDEWAHYGYRWKRAGATHLAVSNHAVGDIDDHIELIATAFDVLRPLHRGRRSNEQPREH